MESAQHIQRQTLRDIVLNPALNGLTLRTLLYIYSEMGVGETKHIALADLVEKIGFHDTAAASKALGNLQKWGYIDKWRRGNNLYVRLLVG
jgi:uncharacterized membrane protein